MEISNDNEEETKSQIETKSLIDELFSPIENSVIAFKSTQVAIGALTSILGRLIHDSTNTPQQVYSYAEFVKDGIIDVSEQIKELEGNDDSC
jgi:hypothetical protein